VEQARVECGDLVAALEQGVIRWDDVRELGEVVAGRRPGRTGPGQITLFESQGVAMEDIAVAVRLVARARERRVGTEIPI
jgi:ornithine cyclodeaminase